MVVCMPIVGRHSGLLGHNTYSASIIAFTGLQHSFSGGVMPKLRQEPGERSLYCLRDYDYRAESSSFMETVIR